MREQLSRSGIEAAEELLGLLLNNLPDPVWLKDREGRCLAVNPACCRLVGKDAQDVVGRTSLEFLPDDVARRVWADDCEVMQSRQPKRFEESFVAPDGDLRWFETIKTPLFDARGEVVGTTGVGHDITDRKRAEALLTAERNLAHRLATLRNLADVVRVCLDAALEVSGLECGGVYAVDPASGSLRLACHRGLGDAFVRAVTEVVPGSVPEQILLTRQWAEISRSDMEPFGLSPAIDDGLTVIAAVPVRFEDRPIASLNIASRRLTAIPPHVRMALEAVAAQMGAVIARAQTEQSLRESQQRLALAANAAQIGMFDWNVLSGEVVWTQQHEVIFGYGPTAAAARIYTYRDWADRVHPDDLPETEESLRRCLAEHTLFQAEYRVVHPDGSIHWVACQGRAYDDAAGQAVRMLGLAMDITRRKQGEQEKRDMERRLLHAQKLESLGVLAGGVAHDFNNILAGIMGYADLASRRLAPTEPARADLEVIQSAVQRAAGLTRQMLAYSGKGKFVVGPLDLSRVVADAREMLAISVSKKADLKYNLAANLPAIRADASQIHQVILNLVINASEALGEDSGAIRVSTDAVELSAAEGDPLHADGELGPGRYVRLEVVDTGCGMDAATRAKIFDPFFSTKFAGRGLGLAAVHGIVRGHEGAIRVASEPGRGTSFQVYFPAAAAE